MNCARLSRNAAPNSTPMRTLMSMVAPKRSSVSSSDGPVTLYPALLTRTSTRPAMSNAVATTRSRSAGSVRSATTGTTRSPRRSTSASRRSARRAAATTVAPAPWSTCTNRSPSPDDAPVTTTTLSWRPKSSCKRSTALSPVGEVGEVGEVGFTARTVPGVRTTTPPPHAAPRAAPPCRSVGGRVSRRSRPAGWCCRRPGRGAARRPGTSAILRAGTPDTRT